MVWRSMITLFWRRWMIWLSGRIFLIRRCFLDSNNEKKRISTHILPSQIINRWTKNSKKNQNQNAKHYSNSFTFHSQKKNLRSLNVIRFSSVRSGVRWRLRQLVGLYAPICKCKSIVMVKRKRLRKISGLIFSKRSKWTFRLKGNISNGRIN